MFLLFLLEGNFTADELYINNKLCIASKCSPIAVHYFMFYYFKI